MNRLESRKGFTMIELVVVIAVLAILVTLAAITYRGVTSSAQDLSIRADLNVLDKAVDIGEAKEGVGTFTGGTAVTYTGILTDVSGNMVYETGAGASDTVVVYPINSTLSSYYKKIVKPLTSYVIDANNNIYYRGAFVENPPGVSPTAGGNVTTVSATSTANSITLNANATARGGSNISARGLEYSTNLSTWTGVAGTAPSGTGTGTFSVTTPTTLSGTTVYYVRPYVTNTAGTSYGPTVTIKTL
jgi:prepilin-type N-terminal cleavage/methylation domain-containing protein